MPDSDAPNLEGYRIHRRIGAGASGVVYEATQASLGRRVAVKVLLAGELEGSQARARFLREAQLQASLSHPSLLAVYDCRIEAGQAYIVTELLPGGSLRGLLDQRKPLGWIELLRLASEMASAIACAHGAGIIHRDLKPENVLLTEDGHAKVADFGIARRAEGGASLTSSGVVMGTPGYLGPEVLDEAEPAPSLDVYALGVILFEMAAGAKPFSGGTVAELLYRQMARPAPSVRTVRADASEAFEALVKRCLERDPAARPAASEVAAVLSRLAKPARRAVPAPQPSPAGRPGRGRFAPALAISGALLAAAATWAVLARHESQEPVAPSATVSPQRPSWPRIAWVATGPTQVKLGLSGPAPAGMRVSWAQGEGRLPAGQPVAPGTREIGIGGLSPASSYRFQLSGAEAPQVVTARTLKHDRNSQAFWLDQRPAREMDAVVAGGKLGLLWRTLGLQPQEVLFSESTDEGRTWTEPAPLGSAAGLRIPCLTRAAGGLLAVWTLEGNPGRTAARFRRDGETGWSDAGSAVGGPHHPQVVSDGKRTELLLWVPGTLTIERRLFTGSRIGDPFPSGKLTWQHGEGIGRCVTIERAGDSLIAFGHRSNRKDISPGSSVIEISRCDAAAGAEWSSRRRLTSSTESPQDYPGLAVLGKAIYLAYVERDAVLVRRSTDGGRTFSEPRVAVPRQSGVKVKRMGLSADASGLRIAVAYTELSVLVETAVSLTTSADGETWTFAGRQRLPLLSASTCVRAVPCGPQTVVLVTDRQDGVVVARFAMP